MREIRTRRRRSPYYSVSGLTGNQLKLIGVLAMLADQIGAVVIQSGILHGRDPELFAAIMATPEGYRLYLIGRVCRFVGRLAFPIFAFLVAEGFLHTRNRWLYAMRLWILAVISEVPFDLAVFGTLVHPAYQNVVFTLLIGVIVLAGLDFFHNYVLQILTLILGCGAACLIQSDYNVLGVLLIAALYWLRHDDTIRLAAGVILSALESLSYFCISALAYVPILLYNGRRGNRGLKYFFYAIYPLQFLILYGITQWILEKVSLI